MKHIMLIAGHEFRELVWRKRFLFVLFSLPALMLGSVALAILSVKMTESTKPVGYVDLAGILDPAQPIPFERGETRFTFVPYPDEASARADLEAQKVQAYYVIQADYLQTRAVKLVYYRRIARDAAAQFQRFLRLSLLTDYPATLRERVLEEPRVDLYELERGRVFPNGDPDVGLFIPLALAVMFMMLVLMSSNYLMAAITKEKENRMAEIMLSTLRPSELIIGKLLGLAGMNLLQLLAWGLMAVVAVAILAANVEVPPSLLHPSLDWRLLAWLLPLALASYLFFATAMIFLGIISPEVEQGQQVGGFFSLLWALPLWLLAPLAQHPASPLALTLSVIPGASLMTLSVRALSMSIPTWQLVLSLFVASLSTGLMIYLTVKAFRLGMLRYGQRLRLHEIWATLRARR